MGKGTVRTHARERELRRWTLEFGVKFDGRQESAEQMIRTHLRRAKSAAWFGEPEFLGREPICVNTEGFGTGGNEKRKETKKKGHDCF